MTFLLIGNRQPHFGETSFSSEDKFFYFFDLAQAIFDPLCVCVTIAIPAISFVSSLFVVFTAAVSRNVLESMEADDCSKGEGWQTQRRWRWMAGQAQMVRSAGQVSGDTKVQSELVT